MIGRFLVGLPAGEERDARNGRRHAILQYTDRLLGDVLGPGAVGRLLAEITMFGFSTMPSSITR
jgi:hypothetical protein